MRSGPVDAVPISPPDFTVVEDTQSPLKCSLHLPISSYTTAKVVSWAKYAKYKQIQERIGCFIKTRWVSLLGFFLHWELCEIPEGKTNKPLKTTKSQHLFIKYRENNTYPQNRENLGKNVTKKTWNSSAIYGKYIYAYN